MTAIARYRRLVNEAAMEAAIREAVALLGGRVFHIRDSRATPEMTDFPDLVVILPERGVVAHVELKSQRRIVTPGQRGVMDMLAQCRDFESFVVRPEPRDEFETSYDGFMDWLKEENR